MRKKLMALLMAAVMVLSCGTIAFAEEYNTVTAAEAATAAKEGTAHILDVRLWENYTAGRLQNSDWSPAFPLDDTSLDAEIADFAKDNYADTTLPIYIVCNSGNKGAIRATAALKAAGIAADRIVTVTGGAKELAKIEGALNTNRFDDAIEWKEVPADVALAAYAAGDVKIVDVRKAEDYAKGHLPGTLNVNLGAPTDAQLQIAAKDTIEKNITKEDTVYLLCYSGNKCAKTAISIMKDLGYDINNVKIITGGANNNESVKELFITLPFTDVAAADWFAPYVENVFAAGLMTGMDKTSFGPTVKLSRAQFATMLWRMAGEPEMEFKATFPDVVDGTWYTDAVLWANSQGIVTGYTHNGLFGTADDITREQLATMLYRYARVMNYTTDAKAELAAFPDGAKVSEFAKAPVAWAVAEGIIKGNDADKTVNPQGNAVRAEAATMLDRFVKYSYDAYQYVDPVDARQVYVSAEYVKNVIDGYLPESENYVILEVAYPGTSDKFAGYGEGHLPGAVYASIMEVEDATGDEKGAYNLLAAEEIEKYALSHGITKDTTVILYAGDGDVSGVARQAYAYLYLGVENVKILNGNEAAWKAAGFAFETAENKGTPATEFGVAVPAKANYWTSIEDAKANVEADANFKLVSIRSEEEWLGKTSGYNYMAKAGEPKGAVWGKGCDSAYDVNGFVNEDGTVKTLEQVLATEWKDVDFTLDNHLAFYCGTGWRASVPFLIMYQEGYDNISLYDGGWYQWIMMDEYPVQVGDPASADCVYTTVGELPNDKAAK